jgi:FkbM family methyltransferase
MKNLIKSIAPNFMMPVLIKIYRKLFLRPQKIKFSPVPGFSHKEFETMSALKCIVSYNKYGGYCVPESSSHRPAATSILLHNIYEPQTIEYIMHNCGNGDVIHAGAYFGDFLPAISKNIGLNSKIWAFEPNQESFRCAEITLKINEIQNVVLTNAGLGVKQEFLPMKVVNEDGHSLGGASQIISKDSIDMLKAEMIQVFAIDDIIGTDRDISIIQLDVENHEKEALMGGIKTIQRCLPIIILEVLPNSELIYSAWFLENILSLGYYESNSDMHGNRVFTCSSLC